MPEYTSKAYFISRLNKYKERDSSHIPKELIDQLDEYMQKHLNFPPAAEIRLKPLDCDGHRGAKTSIETLKKVLKYTKNAKYYRDMNLIARMLWGWELINEEMTRKIEEEYAKMEEAYKKKCKPVPYSRIVLQPPTEAIIAEFKRMADEVSKEDDNYVLIC